MASSRHRPAPLDPRHVPPARSRVVWGALVGLAVGVAVSVATDYRYGLLTGWDAACLVFLVSIWRTTWRCDAPTTRRLAGREDPTRTTMELILISASLVSLLAVGLVLARASHASGTGADVRLALGVASILASWAVVHTVFTLRYARLYYHGSDGGIDFNQDAPPAYRDFAYLAFTIGMTFQVSDTAIASPEIRAVALRHAVLSFVFDTGILATSINLVASLVSG